MRLASFPRVRLGHFPTPLERLDNLSRYLGGPDILVKRDDCTGFAFGGSKVRKLEYSFGAALAGNADTVLIHGSIQSNHARLVAGISARLGLRCILLLEERLPDMPSGYQHSGNILLDHLFGAEVKIFPRGTDLNLRLSEELDQVRAKGARPYVLRGGAPACDGVIGYCGAALELFQQSVDLGFSITHLVLASESAGLQAGMVTGLHALSMETRLLGVSVNRPREIMESAVHDLAIRTASYLGLSDAPLRDAVEVDDSHRGPGYGQPSQETIEVIRLVASKEGLLLDPVYSGKAFAALVSGINDGRFRRGEAVVFLHSGGLPLLFAYEEALSKYPLSSPPESDIDGQPTLKLV